MFHHYEFKVPFIPHLMLFAMLYADAVLAGKPPIGTYRYQLESNDSVVHYI